MKTIAICLGVVAIACITKAEVKTGYFSDSTMVSSDYEEGTSRLPRAQAFIISQKKNASQMSTEYAYLVTATNDGPMGDLFKIEEIENGLQAWIRIYATSKNVLGVNLDHEASYEVSQITSEKSVKLRIRPTPYGRQFDCNVSLDLTFDKESKVSWDPTVFSNGATYIFEGKKHEEIEFRPGSLKGTFVIGYDEYKEQAFSAEFQTPGVLGLRARSLSSETKDGKAVSRTLSMVGLALKEKRKTGFLGWGSGETKLQLQLLKYSDKTPENCGSKLRQINEG